MRFRCAQCGEEMDSSLVNEDAIKLYRRTQDVKVLPCPFCHAKGALARI